MILKCLIVDDEPLARGVVRDFLDLLPDIEIVGEAATAEKALLLLKETTVDVIFLDIQMPGLTGIELVKALVSPPAVIFITAYPDHAVEGFALEAVDYLVKPFSFARLTEAVNRARKRLGPSLPHTLATHTTFKVDKRLLKVAYKDLYYFQSAGDFAKVFHTGNTLIVSETIKKLTERLPCPPFLRIHKSYMINLDHLEYMEGNYVAIQGNHIPIGASYRDTLKAHLS